MSEKSNTQKREQQEPINLSSLVADLQDLLKESCESHKHVKLLSNDVLWRSELLQSQCKELELKEKEIQSKLNVISEYVYA